jgi:hypothetical protein
VDLDAIERMADRSVLRIRVEQELQLPSGDNWNSPLLSARPSGGTTPFDEIEGRSCGSFVSGHSHEHEH